MYVSATSVLILDALNTYLSHYVCVLDMQELTCRSKMWINQQWRQAHMKENSSSTIYISKKGYFPNADGK